MRPRRNRTRTHISEGKTWTESYVLDGPRELVAIRIDGVQVRTQAFIHGVELDEVVAMSEVKAGGGSVSTVLSFIHDDAQHSTIGITTAVGAA